MMFKKLTNYSYKRTGKEAFGFYLAYLLAAIIIGSLIGGAISLESGEVSYDTIVRIVPLFTALFCIGLSITILVKKKLTDSFLYVILALVSGLFALLLGGFLGLVIPAYFSSLKKKK